MKDRNTLLLELRTKDEWKFFNPIKSVDSWKLTIQELDFDELARKVCFSYSVLIKNKFQLNIENCITGIDRTFRYCGIAPLPGRVDHWISLNGSIHLYVRRRI